MVLNLHNEIHFTSINEEVQKMDQQIKELTLLLLYITSWEDMELKSLGEFRRSWKGYDFTVLNELTDEDFIVGSKKAKSVYLTEDGIKKAKDLMKKYQIDD